MEGLDVDLTAAREANPSLITVSMSPFGGDGPKAGWAATDLTLVAASGFMICNGDSDRPPVRISLPQAWLHGSCQAVVAALIANHERITSGRGQHVDLSVQQAMTEPAVPAILHGPAGLPPQSRFAGGLQQGDQVLRWVYECADGHALIMVSFGPMVGPMLARFIDWMYEEGACDEATRDRDWVNFALNLQTGEEKLETLDELCDTIEAFARTRTKAQVSEQSIARKLLITPVADLAEVLASPQLSDRGFWDDVDGVRLPGPFVRSEVTPLRSLGPAPAAGEHDDEVRVASADRPVLPAPGKKAPVGRPLAGLKVLDFSWVAAAPLTTKLLAHWGATVVRIETSRRPCLTRVALGHRDDIADQEEAIFWHAVNAGKHVISLDLSGDDARDVVADLVRWADLALESFTEVTVAGSHFIQEDSPHEIGDAIAAWLPTLD